MEFQRPPDAVQHATTRQPSLQFFWEMPAEAYCSFAKHRAVSGAGCFHTGISVSIIIGIITTFLFGSTFIMAGAAGGAVIGETCCSTSMEHLPCSALASDGIANVFGDGPGKPISECRRTKISQGLQYLALSTGFWPDAYPRTCAIHRVVFLGLDACSV